MSIIVNKLTYYYNTGTPYSRLALDEISFEVGEGEIFGIIGPCGSGKSTLLQHLSGLLEPESGTVLIDGKKAGAIKDIFHKVGLIWQFPEQQFFEDTVYDEIAYGLYNLGHRGKPVDELVRLAMGMVGMEFNKFEGRPPFTLSSGEMRRCSIASVLAMDTGIVIVDEPLAGLDREGRERIIRCLKNVQEKGRTVIYASRRDELQRYCNSKTIHMEKGEVVIGKPAEHES